MRRLVLLLLALLSMGMASDVGWLGAPRLRGYFVDSVNGSDTSSCIAAATRDGRLVRGTPCKSIARLYAVGPPPGARIYLARGSYWRESLHIANGGLPDGCQIAAYGPRVANPVDDLGRALRDAAGAVDDRPRFSGANVIPSNAWTKTVGATNVYQTTLDTSIVFYGWGGMGMRIWEDWQGSGPAGRLLWVADVATVDATPGSWTGPERPTHGNDTVYLHPTGSSDPRTNGRVYEWPARPWGLNAGQQVADARKMASVRGVSVDRHGHHDGGLLTATYLQDFSVDAGGAGTQDPSHGLWCNGTCEDGVASSVISYGNSIPPTTVRRVRSMCSSPRQGVTSVNGFFFHNDGQAGHEHQKKTFIDISGPTAASGYTCSNLVSGGSATQILVIRPRADENTVMTLAGLGNSPRIDIVDPVHIRYGYGTGSIRSIVIADNGVGYVWGGRIVLDSGVPYGAVAAESGASLSVTGTSIVYVGTTGTRYGVASAVAGGTLNVTRCAFHNTFEAVNASAATQGTIDRNVYTTSVNSWRHNGSQSVTFGAWQGRGYDVNGARSAWTLAGDPTTGDTRPTLGTDPWTVGAGADAYGDAHLAEWIAAIP